MREIRFAFDFISPYAYLAWTQVHALAERNGARVVAEPVLFAGLLNAHGQKGPAEVPAKRIYVFKDTLRRAALLGVPLAPPPSHPFNPLTALRAVIAAPDDARRPLIDALFDATWGDAEEKGIGDPAVVAAAADRAGLDGPALVERTREPAIKDALRANTEAAIAAGVFGVPSLRVGDELFWGLDSLDLLERHLRGEDPVTPARVAAFTDVPASAKR